MAGDEKLPAGWIKVKSKSRPGKNFFYNAKRRISLWRIEDLEKFENDKLIDSKATNFSPVKPPTKPLNGKSSGVSIQSKNIAKKNIAKERMTKLKSALADEAKRGTELNTNKPKQSTNLAKVVPAIEKKNVASKRMKNLNDQLKKEVKISQISTKPKAPKESPVTFSSDTKQDEEVELMEVSFGSQPEEYESMEWEDIPEEKIIEEVQKIRKLETVKQDSSVFLSHCKSERAADFFIVVDTNVLLSNLDFIKDIKGKQFKDIGRATIFLPYIVLCELDRIKAHDDSLARIARRAINFLDECFKARDVFITGESALESVNNRVIPVECGDDEIINCCLNKLETTGKLLLLTNDKNLRNKAFVNKIEAFSRDMLNFTDFNAKNEIVFD